MPSSSLGLGPDEVGQKDLKQLHSLTRKTNQNFFLLQSQRLAKSFEGMNSSLAQSLAGIFPCKNMCKLMDFHQNGSQGVNISQSIVQ